MAYFFLLPNLAIFGICVLFPMLLNFYYSGTGGTRLFPEDREWIGTGNYETISTAKILVIPTRAGQDQFWRAVSNTITFVVFQ